MESDLGKFTGKDWSSLKSRLEILEKENLALKRSLYDLSLKFSQLSTSVAASRSKIPFGCGGLDVWSVDFGATSQADTQTGPYASSESCHEGEKLNLVFKNELKGHNGAVYDVEFSPSGKFIASGSFDKTVRIWHGLAPHKEVFCFKEHTLNVSDLCWSKDSSELLSGSFDNTCKVWDINSGKSVYSYSASGLVQCVMFSNNDTRIFFAGASRNDLLTIDRRMYANARTIKCQAMINSIMAYDHYITTADALGNIEIWDTRSITKVLSQLNEPTKNTISDINLCKSASENNYTDGLLARGYMSVNGCDNGISLCEVLDPFIHNPYDTVLRVYMIDSRNSEPSLKLTHALKGHKNKNWPIKSSFVRYSPSGEKGLETLSGDINPEESESEFKLKYPSECMYIATGSADPFVYLFRISESEGQNSSLVKKFEGHTDKVYAVDIHPTEMIICSCSADSTLKIWSIPQARK